MVTIVVFDDNAHERAGIHALIEQQMPAGDDFAIIEAATFDELMGILSSDEPIDVLFSDVILPDGQPSGIEIVQRYFPPESGTQVIFMSGHLEQAPEVYAADHLYFLLKPVNPERLADALCKARAAVARRNPTMLRIKVGHKEHLVNASTIRYLESSLHKVRVYCRSHTYETYAKLDELQEQLPGTFTRCHRSYLVNLSCVSELKENEVHLHDGTVLPVSRRRAHQMQHDLLTYLAARG